MKNHLEMLLFYLKRSLFHQEMRLFRQETPLFDQEMPLFLQEMPLFKQETPLFKQEMSLFYKETSLFEEETPLFAQQRLPFASQQHFCGHQKEGLLSQRLILQIISTFMISIYSQNTNNQFERRMFIFLLTIKEDVPKKLFRGISSLNI